MLLAGTASATLVPRISFEALTDASELIVSGHVTRSWTAWDSEHKYIWTHYELAATSAYKGVAATGSLVEFAEPGGALDGKVMMIEGAVNYGPGDQVVVFLSRMPNRYLRTTGWAQGKYEVDTAGRLHGSAALGDALRSLEGMNVTELRQRIAARLRPAGSGRLQ